MKVKLANNQKDLIHALLVRTEVFVIEQGIDISLEIDELDCTSKHYCLMNDNEVIGTCRLYDEGGIAHLGRIAILKKERKKGLGVFLIHEMEKIASELGYKKIVLGGQCRVIPFYEKCGFKPFGEIYLDADIEHQMMEKNL